MNEYFKLTVKPAGTNASEFVNHYSKYYYGETPEGGVPAILLGLNSSNHDIEEIVDDLLIKGLSDPDTISKLNGITFKSATVKYRKIQSEQVIDFSKKGSEYKVVYLILAWKIGAILHEYSSKTTFVFRASSKREANKKDKNPVSYVTSGTTTVEITDNLVKAVFNAYNNTDFSDLAKIDLAQIIDSFMYQNSGIGFVYAITLLFFISNGKFPIYDRFAHKALLALYCETDIRIVGEGITLPKISDKSKSQIRETRLKSINTLLKDIYGYSQNKETIISPHAYLPLLKNFPDYQTNRNVDRALWVYGHFFPDNTNEVEEQN